LKTRQVLPYLAALLLLAWILGTLARSGTGGTSILSNSYWLVYLAYLVPFLALGAMVVMVIYLARSWKTLSDAIGSGIARQRRIARRKNRKVQFVVWLSFWGLGAGVLFWKCGGIICRPSGNETQTLPENLENLVQGGQGGASPIAVLEGPAKALVSIIGSGAFMWAFLGLLVVSSVILARSFLVSMEEPPVQYLPARVQAEGTVAVEEALRLLEMEEVADPRARIMACYERMVRAAAGLGAHVRLDQTARELEWGIRETFQLKGNGIADLTRLFEEARYSLHTITEEDSRNAQLCLSEIGEELKATVSVEN